MLARNVRANNMMYVTNKITKAEAKIVNARLSRVIHDIADVFQAYDYGFDCGAFVSTATAYMDLS